MKKYYATTEAVELHEYLWAKYDDLDSVKAILEDTLKYNQKMIDGVPLEEF
jgi:hypothetical protein